MLTEKSNQAMRVFLLSIWLIVVFIPITLQARFKSLGPRPPKCGYQGCYGSDIGSNVNDNAWNGELTVSPVIVKIGQKITVTAVPISSDTAVTITPFPGKPVSGPCVNSPSGVSYTGSPGQSLSCTFKATFATAGWVNITAYFSGNVGTGVEEEAYAVLEKKSPYYISGQIRSIPFDEQTQGVGIQDMEVFLYKLEPRKNNKQKHKRKHHRKKRKRRRRHKRITSAHQQRHFKIKLIDKTKTAIDGYYVFKVRKKGRYRVIPLLRDSDTALDITPDLQPAKKDVKVVRQRTANVNFTLTRGQTLKLIVTDQNGTKLTSVPADGLHRGIVRVTLKGPNDEPRKGRMISFHFASVKTGGGVPALMCESSSNHLRIWPTANSDGTPNYGHLAERELKTSDLSVNGTSTAGVQADLLFGNAPGTFTVYAEVTSDLSASDSYSIVLTSTAAGVMTSDKLASIIFNTITSKNSLGKLVLDSNAPFTFQNTPSAQEDRSVSDMMDYFSWLRGYIDGYEFAPVQGKDNNGNSVYAIIVYPAGSRVRNGGIGTFPATSLVMDNTMQGLSELINIPGGNPNLGYTVNQLHTVNQWKSLHGIGNLVIRDFRNGTGLFGGAPYKTSFFSQAGTVNCLQGLN
ncbi:MAG: hypothetical protein D6719_12360 [Candidatus Dadabacteria bacterium]|nr:MAG: hypothetical protein D6719_12360 [Candidatus Dadabacteria bacterium]